MGEEPQEAISMADTDRYDCFDGEDKLTEAEEMEKKVAEAMEQRAKEAIESISLRETKEFRNSVILLNFASQALLDAESDFRKSGDEGKLMKDLEKIMDGVSTKDSSTVLSIYAESFPKEDGDGEKTQTIKADPSAAKPIDNDDF